MENLDKDKTIATLNRIMELELAGVVRYTHYSLMVFGYNRIPIVSWLRAQADEGLVHAQRAGELITLLGGHPSLGIGPLLESHHHEIGAILRESLAHETESLNHYYELFRLSEGRSVLIEDYARELITEEEMHAGEINKMLRNPGEVAAFKQG
ncbi:MAG TPA: ferritin-like domain-containing protein [Rhodocyclaceae bacterium]